jgi:hypothetical protein
VKGAFTVLDTSISNCKKPHPRRVTRPARPWISTMKKNVEAAWVTRHCATIPREKRIWNGEVSSTFVSARRRMLPETSTGLSSMNQRSMSTR